MQSEPMIYTEDCLKISARQDGQDGSGNYKFVIKITHNGHQSYGQNFTLKFSCDIFLVEVPGDFQAEVSGNTMLCKRDNQLNDNGLTEVWIKVSAPEQPEVVGVSEITCEKRRSDSDAIFKTA